MPGLQLANSFVRSGQARSVAVVCSEPLLSLFDLAQRERHYLLSRVLFGEGAAAVIVTDRDVSEGRLPELVDSEVLLGQGSTELFSLRREESWAFRLDKRVPEVGVGTAYLPDHTRFPSEQPRITLMDLNPNTLTFGARRLRRYQPRTRVANLLEPID